MGIQGGGELLLGEVATGELNYLKFCHSRARQSAIGNALRFRFSVM